MKKYVLYTKKEAIEYLDLTTTLFNKLNLEPDEIKKRYLDYGCVHLFSMKRLNQIKKQKRYKRLLASKRQPPTPVDYFSKFNKKYSFWKESTEDACEGLFALNRYAKYPSCSNENKEEIYSLKSRFINFLHNNGYATDIHIHAQYISGKQCYRCYGEGCDRCYDTGFYREPDVIEFYCISFDINGSNFTWHTPKYEYDMDFGEIEIDADKVGKKVIPVATPKPIRLASYKFKQAKELISWVLETSKLEVEHA